MIKIALSYLKLGWCPIPIRPQTSFFKDKKPYIRWKKYQKQRPSEEEIRTWWTRWPTAGIGIVTGLISNLLSIDFDGLSAQYKYIEEIGNRPNTISFSSREGHEQDLYRYPTEQNIKNITGLFKGIDVRGQGGLVVVPPSKHWSGSLYSWGPINPLEDGLEDLMNLPERALHTMLNLSEQETQSKSSSSLKKSNKQKTAMPDWMIKLSHGVAEGERNAAAARVTGWYLRFYHGDVAMTRLSLQGWNTKCRPPLPEKELGGIITKISMKHGTEDLSTKCGIKIDKVIFYKAPDGDSHFEMFIDGIKGESIIFNPADICSNTLFRTKIIGYTGKCPDVISNKDFVPLIQRALAEAEIKPLAKTLTHEGFIAEIIQQKIQDPGSSINNSFVVTDDNIYFKMSLLKKRVIEKREDPMSRVAINKCLTSLGFKATIKRDENQKQQRVMVGNLKDFEDYFNDEKRV